MIIKTILLYSEQHADEAVVFDLVGERASETDVSLALWYLEKGADRVIILTGDDNERPKCTYDTKFDRGHYH